MWRTVPISNPRRVVLALVAVLAAASSLASTARPDHGARGESTGPRLALRSPDLSTREAIPLRHIYDRFGCRGGNISPALSWNGPPAGTRSFAVLMFDPDAPGGAWWHWAVFDIPAAATSLRTGAGDPASGLLPPGAIQARNDFGFPGYGGPCPPPGPPHHYHLVLYALRVPKLRLDASASAAQVAATAQANALAKAEIVRVYGR